ncbi:DNA topoisomerase 2-associated protein pat1 [Emydomyces testavorans]|uniref:DNA topoisomerase 2-associated protein pat1 n=1 Tax=Emydomyces testavorans TaxID=2070801 RepID=A0AAF0DHS8_9EURO|nr:DNA topoisomerase 2-associated protein pat1 [Emydomyces testavorans]
MSFFGFHTTLPNDLPPARESRGIFENPDPFAEVARATAHGLHDGYDDAIDFEDTYDGLGDRLDDAQDAFNEDTFGDAAGNEEKPVGKDFDFFGQTAQMTNVLGEEQVLYNLKHPNEHPTSSAPSAEPSKPKRTGYEPYQDPGYIPEIQAKSSVWGTGIIQKPKAAEQPKAAPPTRKILSLEEVEAQMRTQTQRPQSNIEPPHPVQQFPTMIPQTGPSNLQFPDQPLPPPDTFPQFQRKDFPPLNQHQQYSQVVRDGVIQQGFQRQPPRPFPEQQPKPNLPLQILQHQNRMPNMPPQRPTGPQFQGPYTQPAAPPTTGGQPSIAAMHPQFMQLPEEQRKALLAEDAKRAKRNHKIHILSKGNGLMTPQDKNFITRIQLQQLVSATGNTEETDADSLLSEDFYYQVYSQIRGAPRQHPRQPLGHFAQTYLFQTGGRSGGHTGRRQYQNADNHMQRMQQQVQRAVEAAKLRPKNKQLIIEGSLGKISFSNAKGPRTLLNIKRPDSADGHKPANARKSAQTGLSPSDRKSILNNIENVYDTMMKMEDHERKMPPPPDAEDVEAVERHFEWKQKMDALNQKLWRDMKVHEPIFPGSTTTHPFIAFLSYPKGKKAIPRIFHHIDQEQRVTILTMIIVHLDSVDVVQRAQLQPGETQPPGPVREEIDLFSQAVMPSLLGYVSEAPLKIIIGLLGLVVFRTNVHAVSKTRIGLGILTMLLSRAELVKEAGTVDDEEWRQWTDLYNKLFDRLEPVLGDIFPGTINSGDDMYVWQFLAAVGIGANPEQQQRLVIAVKDRVMETVSQSKTLPADMASQRLNNVNLFMRAIGLDVELLG